MFAIMPSVVDGQSDEDSVLRSGVAKLTELLGLGWEVAPLAMGAPVGGNTVAGVTTHPNMVWTVRHSTGGGGQGQVLLEAVAELSPARAETLLAVQVALMQQLSGQVAVLILAPWLSPRTRAVLERRGFGYLDLTGNVSFHLALPPVRITTTGAQRNPVPSAETRRGLSGAKAGRLVRVLVDFAPPYTARELVEAANISEGYLSRLLDVMSDEALIIRDGRKIVGTDWVGLLHARARTYRVLRANLVVPMVARRGRGHVLEALAAPAMQDRAVLTGSVPAQVLAPTAVGGQVMIYVRPGPHEVDEVAAHLGLLRSSERSAADASGAVLLLQAQNNTPFDRTAPLEGEPLIQRVALSQLVLDCLGGPGRMPAEGQALLQLMQNSVDAWRQPTLPDPALPDPALPDLPGESTA